VLSVVTGLTRARAWGLAPGGTIVLVAVGVFAVLAAIDAVAGEGGLVRSVVHE